MNRVLNLRRKAGQVIGGSIFYVHKRIPPMPRCIKTHLMLRYCTAMVTGLESTPPMLSDTGIASPVGTFAGTRALTW